MSSKSSIAAVKAATSRLQGTVRKRKPVVAAREEKKIRVCVLSSSYDGSDSPTAAVDNYNCSPSFWVDKRKNKFTFADVQIKKNEAYSRVRELVASGDYDVFYNLCDGARDEKRAGVDVVLALESLNAAYTGADSRSFEPNKVDMKVLVANANVKTPNFVLVDSAKDLAKKCRHLKFPVIVKHMSGYASVGITKESRCETLQQLDKQVRRSLKEFNHALVEEFITGKEGTVLVAADPTKPLGVRVFQPVMYTWLTSDDDFAHFDSKWSWTSTTEFMPLTDPCFQQVQDMARNAFLHIMGGVGYGRCDFRIDKSGAVYFLEINANCGMLYDPEIVPGGDFADMMVDNEQGYNHDTFISDQISLALKAQERRAPWYCISHDARGHFSTRSSRNVLEGTPLFDDPNYPVPVVAKSLFQAGEDDATVGCVICRGDGINAVVAIRHSCEPNMRFMHGRTLTFESARPISKGEELTVDYATLRDCRMPAFACSCGTATCRSVVFSDGITPRVSLQRKRIERRHRHNLLRQKKSSTQRNLTPPGALHVAPEPALNNPLDTAEAVGAAMEALELSDVPLEPLESVSDATPSSVGESGTNSDNDKTH